MLDFWDILIPYSVSPTTTADTRFFFPRWKFLNVKGDLFHQISWTCLGARDAIRKPNENDGVFQPHLVPVSNFNSFKQRNSGTFERNMFQSGENQSWHVSTMDFMNVELSKTYFLFVEGLFTKRTCKHLPVASSLVRFLNFRKEITTPHTCAIRWRSRLNFPHFLTNRSSLVRVTLSPTTKSTLGCWFVEGAGNR